ncbi:PcfJ domain-containing protein [Endozoicomonas gorgoniicola]|uniref:PcfJ domain-containing protein n=1 Tax=Endozoicomonas gorgoniicola TaxID=1234144 RepID=A0ABT3MYK1_9GAMM|nr:PcfJ domain-containing protein [Endozoicomonas gorgoniicola]MCW7554437.1 PcfJ domain-containing protein [Endozoicomonas gorgoniicola]
MSPLNANTSLYLLLKSSEHRAFIAEVAEQLCFGSPRLTETEFNFGRHTVELGMHEKRTGLICCGNYVSQGKPKAEVANPQLEQDIRSLVDPESEGRRMEHCVGSYIRTVQGGNYFVYHMESPESLTIGVRVRQGCITNYDQIEGVRNGRPTEEAKNKVLAWITAAVSKKTSFIA